MKLAIGLIALASNVHFTLAACPGQDAGTPPSEMDDTIPALADYNTAVATLDIEAVFQDIHDLLTSSQDCWPADTHATVPGGHYGGFFIRLAWHCAGTFRLDGNGGCAGGRQRFPPESTWEDNGNLDHARALLAPIKEEYGDALSWGDLFVFAGTASILSMGGPVTEVCAGRIDDVDGNKSAILDDPNGDCTDIGNCQLPLGAVQPGLIYVNPEGVGGVPDPAASAVRIRDVFGRMGMNDEETVALIGGGHAFGKAHGDESVVKTSGLEGFWTSTPYQWSNEFFTQLRDDNYTQTTSPAGAKQYENDRNGLMMLDTDLALVNDENYTAISHAFADDITKLNTAFGNVWEKLMTQGGEWATNKKCIDASTIDLTMADDDTATTTAAPMGTTGSTMPDDDTAATTGAPDGTSWAVMPFVSLLAVIAGIFVYL